ncbi:MAG: MFS transporter [Acidobacteria bacterium]|nr:MFS transporter [Acidobacteriota bacterium]
MACSSRPLSWHSLDVEFPHAVRALRSRNYRLFAGGQLISLIGTWMQMVAQAWLIYRLTGSAVLLGVAGFTAQIPVFVLAPLGGVIADRLDRRRVLIVAQAVMMLLALILAGLTFSGAVRVWHIYTLAALLGVANAFDIPARQSFVVEMVGRESLPNAIALNSSMFNAARLVGPAVAGAVVAVVGEAWCFLINGLSYSAVIAALVAMGPSATVGRTRATVSAWESVVEGFEFAWRTRPVRALLLLLGLVSLMGMPYSVLMPIFADRLLGGGPSAYGLLMSAAGSGALAGAGTMTLRRDLRGLGRWIAFAASGFGVSLILFSVSRSLLLSAALLVPVGFFMMIGMAASNTLIQAMVPDRLRGRVMAVYSMMFMGMAPMGALMAGALAAPVGAPATVAFGGAVCVVGGIAFGFYLPALRAPARQLIASQQMSAGASPDEA